MKLWLQLLFAQGYLWRDRFPEAFAKTNEEARKVNVLYALPILIAGAGLLGIADGRWATGVLFILIGLGWFLFTSHPLRIDRVTGHAEGWMSLTWVAGHVMAVAISALAVVAVATGEWSLAAASALLWICLGVGWLYRLESNYVLFRYPDANQWRLEPTATIQKGFVAYWRLLVTEAFWHLPRQIIFGIEPPHRPRGAT